MSKFWDFVHGHLTCSLDEKAPERFMNLCHSRGIYLQNIKYKQQRVEFDIGLREFRAIRPVVQKCHSVPKIIRRRGLPFILYKNRRHRAFFIGIILALAILGLLSTYVWDIEIEGNSVHTDEVLTAYMKEIDIHTGKMKKDIDTSYLEEELRLKYEDISWVSARIDGTVLKIQLKEAKVLTPDDSADTPGSIIAWQDGVVESIVTRTGTAKVAAGDEIKAGDTLIEGIVDVMNDDLTVKNSHAVRADGDVYAKVTYHCNDYYPAFYTKKNFTGKKKYELNVEIFGQKLTVGKAGLPVSTDNEPYQYDEVEQLTKYRLTKNFYLPLNLNLKTVRQYAPETVPYTSEEMNALGVQAITDKIKQLEEDGAKIVHSDLQTVINEHYYAIQGDIEMIIPVGKFLPVD